MQCDLYVSLHCFIVRDSSFLYSFFHSLLLIILFGTNQSEEKKTADKRMRQSVFIAYVPFFYLILLQSPFNLCPTEKSAHAHTHTH